MTGKFITIEGIEGAGKSTAMAFIEEFMQSKQIPYVLTREPGGTVLGEKLRELVLTSELKNSIHKNAELLIMFASRAQHLQEKIIPELEKGTWVISDRYIDATYAYQGGGREIDKESIAMLDKWIVKNQYPDLTLLFDIPPQLGLSRMGDRQILDRIELEETEFFTKVRQAYRERAFADPDRIKMLDASMAISIVKSQIFYELNNFIQRI